MFKPRLTFGKHKGQHIESVPTAYLRWLQRADDLEPYLLREIEAELCRRGQRVVTADALLADLEEELTRAVSEEADVCHGCAGRLTDCVMDAFDAVRRRHGVSDGTLLETAASERPGRFRQD